MQRLIQFLFYFPLALNLLNLQAFVSKFISASIAQLMAYINLGIIFLGILFILKKTKRFPRLVLMWFLFFLCYFTFGLLANAIHGTAPPLLKILIPIVYLLGYSLFLGVSEKIDNTAKVIAVLFFTSCLLLILLNYFNFSLDHDGIYQYSLDRAGGVYGDANNSAVAAILSFVFINYSFKPKGKIQNLVKIFALQISAYALILTFSKTGIVVFILIIIITYHKLFSFKRILFSLIFIPLLVILTFNWAKSTNSLSPGQKERIENVFDILTLQTQKVSFSERDLLFKNMLGYISENPFLGNGLNFAVEIRGHNTIFGIWADAGFLTFLLFLILIMAYFNSAIIVKNGLRVFALSVLITLTIFMLSLQTIINQGYLIVVFVLLGYMLEPMQKSLKVKV